MNARNTVNQTVPQRPAVLFICVKNGGKSQMAAALMRQLAGAQVEVHSAGTKPGDKLNALSIQALDEVGASTDGEAPKPLDPDLLARMDVVVTLGEDAHVKPVPGPRFETWVTDEPSERGIDGIERMRLVRNDIAARVERLATHLGMPPK
jgi:arsenate-mycothiol transferase